MKRKTFAVLIALCLALTLCVPALAASDYYYVYDATEMLDADFLGEMGNVTLPGIAEAYGFDMRVDVVTDTEGETIEDYARIFYDQYEYGQGDDHSGVLLMVELRVESESDLAFVDYALCTNGYGSELLSGETLSTLETDLDAYLNELMWDAEIYDDQLAFNNALSVYAYEISYLLTPEGAADTGGGEQTESGAAGYVYDYYGLLTSDEALQLENSAAAASKQYGCGVYIMVVGDYTDYGSGSIYDFAKDFYRSYDLGWGAGRDGVMLTLSMADRDYWLIAYGDKGNAASRTMAKEVLADQFLDNFKNDDWYGGFTDYVSACAGFLAQEDAGTPIDVNNGGDYVPTFEFWSFLIMVILIPCGIALIVCLIMKFKMRSVFKAAEADEYVSPGSFDVRQSWDRFLHTTETRVKIEKNDSGGTSVDSDGFSGSGGNF